MRLWASQVPKIHFPGQLGGAQANKAFNTSPPGWPLEAHSHLSPEPAEPRAGALVKAVVGELGWWGGVAGGQTLAGQQCGQRLGMTGSQVFALEMSHLITSLLVPASHCWWPIYNQGPLVRELARPRRAH